VEETGGNYLSVLARRARGQDNAGEGTAYNAGLHIMAYDAKGKLKVNMAVPLANTASFGTDANTVACALKHDCGTNRCNSGIS
jgi:hypothetical protein